MQRLEDDIAASVAPVTDEEARAFYQANPQRFATPEAFHAAHIVRHVNESQSEPQAKAAIMAALAELERGEPFGEVADRHSDCKGNGGDLGRFDAGHMVEAFEAELRKLAPGQRSGVFTTLFGFHIAELRARYPSGQAEFEMVRDDVRDALGTMRKRRAWLRVVDELRVRAAIVRISEADAARMRS